MKELITRVEELAVQASRDARQIETLQGLLKASQSDLMAELTDAIERKKKIDQLASENAAFRAEVPIESTREALKNAVAKLQEVTTEKDRMRLQLENARADLKQVLIERDSLGLMAADRALEIRKLMDGHAEDMKAQAELLSKYESLLTKITDLGSYAMTLRYLLSGTRSGEKAR